MPDPYNPQDWDRYSYARNNPVRYNDPSGHMVEDDNDGGSCDLFCFAEARDLTPSKILKLNKNNRSDDVDQAVNDYMSRHPEYKPGKDDFEQDSKGYGAFYNIRQEYWHDRCLAGNGCDLLYDPDRLFRHYDLQENIQFMRFDPSQVDWISTGLDSTSFGLGVTALVVVPEYAVWANLTSQGVGAFSAFRSFSSGDESGGWLSVGGYTRPPFGTLASGASVIRDLSQGIYYVPYIPPITRVLC